MTQRMYPVGDYANAGGWTGTAGLYTSLDEATPNDADYVSSPSNPSAGLTLELSLADVDEPVKGTNDSFLRIRARKSGGKSASLAYALLDAAGTAKVSQSLSILPTSFAQTDTIASSNAWATGALNGARLQLAGSTSGGGSPTTVDVSWFSLDVPNPPTPPTPAAPAVSSTTDYVHVTFVPVANTTITAQWSNDGVNWNALTSGYTSPDYFLNNTDPTLSYYFRYQYVNAGGPGGWSPTSAAGVSDPPAPTGVSAGAGPNKATISATAAPFATKYKVYRGLAGGARSLVFTSALIPANTALSWEDTGVVNGTAYDYHVTAEVQTPTVRESAASSVVTVTPSNAVTYTPIISNDDGTAGDFAGFFNTTSNLFVGNDLVDGVYRVWIRFPGLTIGQGETVPQATLRLCVKTTQNNGNDIHLLAAFVDVDNASNPSYSAAVFGLPYDNTNRVDFDVIDGSPTNTYIDLDVTAGLQAIVNRPGWASGNAVEIVLVDNGTSAGTVGSIASVGYALPYRPQLIVDMTPSGPVPSQGDAAGTTSWSGAGAGAAPVLPTLSGSASGAFGVTGSATGAAPALAQKVGTATGGFAVAGSAAGSAPVIPMAAGSATGASSFAGAATGAAPVLPDLSGSAAGSFDLSGSAAGSALPSGSASGTTLLAGLAAGVAEHTGSTSGGFGSSGSATGSTATSGATAGAFSYTGSATGGAAAVPPALGTATGSFGLTSSATGATAHEGASSGGFAASGSAAGSALHEGAGSGGFAIAGTSTGSAPALDVQTGSAHGAFTLAGSASGATSARGDGSGALSLSGTAAGSAPSGGAGAGAWAAVGDAAGASSREGVAGGGFAVTASAAGTAPLVGTESGAGAGTFRFTGTASGQRHQSGDAAGSFALSGAALGDAPAVAGVSGSAAGSLSWSGDATGTTAPLGTASGVVTVAGSASGSAPVLPIPTGSAGGSVELSGASSGTAPNGGAASGSVTWTGVALAGYWGVRSGSATGSWTNYGRAHGRPTYPQVKHTAATINHNLTGANSTPNTTGARVATNGASARVRAVY